jgi:hypothetical protein
VPRLSGDSESRADHDVGVHVTRTVSAATPSRNFKLRPIGDTPDGGGPRLRAVNADSGLGSTRESGSPESAAGGGSPESVSGSPACG